MTHKETNMHLPLITRIDLRVRDRARMVDFYRSILGLEIVYEDQGEMLLSSATDEAQVRLVEEPDAAIRRPHTTGLYHVAFLFPTRRALAQKISMLIEMGWPLHGLVDHGVSEALYLSDPEGNGLEFAVDRPYSAWPLQGGKVAMYTESLSVERFLQEGMSETPHPPEAPPIIGHVHLSVADLAEAEAFFVGELGLKVTQNTYPGALFFAKGAYHHHFAANTWARAKMSPSELKQTGLIGCQLADYLSLYLDLQQGYAAVETSNEVQSV